MRRALFLILAVAIALCACRRAAEPLRHEAYVWQRLWTADVAAAMTNAGTTFSAYRVLAAESNRSGALVAIVPDLAALAAGAWPVTAVVRVNGSDPPPDAAALIARSEAIVREWRAAGVHLAGIEIDHDCATSRLAEYAGVLAALRAALPRDLTLSITALPAWLDSPALPALLAAADESVLQVRAVQSPSAGLFDSAAARRWIAAYAAKSTRPFHVALPAYGVRAPFDANGRAAAVEGEAPRDLEAGDVPVLRVAPDQVAQVVRVLERDRPAALAGIVWFRLPLADDRRAWSLTTLRAVIAGESLRPVVKVTFDAAENGAHDLVLANVGDVDAHAPARIVVAAYGCSAGDALEGYRLERMGDDWRFVATADNMVRAGHERRVGWLRCDTVQGVKIDEVP